MVRKYRLGVGLIVVNLDGKVLSAKRARNRPGKGEWQMPQGGIDKKDKDVKTAALRELKEETGIKSGKILAVSKGWTHYLYPAEVQGRWDEIGQKHKWVLFLFTGDDSEIAFTHSETVEYDGKKIDEIEFFDYKWTTPEEIIKEVVYFKREVYRQAFMEFIRFF